MFWRIRYWVDSFIPCKYYLNCSERYPQYKTIYKGCMRIRQNSCETAKAWKKNLESKIEQKGGNEKENGKNNY